MPTPSPVNAIHDDDVVYGIFSARSAKRLSCVLLFLVFLYHCLLKLHYGENTCVGLLEDGRFQGANIWQPYGCMLHNYSRSEARTCMQYNKYWGERNNIVFVGGSRVHQLFASLANHFAVEASERYSQPNVPPDPSQAALLSNSNYTDEGIDLNVVFLRHDSLSPSFVSVLAPYLSAPARPKLLIVDVGFADMAELQAAQNRPTPPQPQAKKGTRGGLLDMLRSTNTTQIDFPTLEESVHLFLSKFHQPAESTPTTVLWLLQGPITNRNATVVPGGLAQDSAKRFNKALRSALSSAHFVSIWESSYLIRSEGDRSAVMAPDGFHSGPVALDYDVQILLNLYCNDRMNYPDGTCCSTAEPSTLLQDILLSLCTLVVVMYLLHRLITCLRSPHWSHPRSLVSHLVNQVTDVSKHRLSPVTSDASEDHPTTNGYASVLEHEPVAPTCQPALFTVVAELCVLMLFAYVCDRTSMFMKENKWFTFFNFFLPVCYVGVLGLFFTEDQSASSFLHDEQTAEWRGWMQVIVLTFHMVGAGKVLWIYMLYRGLISSYLFLLGFEHMTYFWSTGDVTIKRLLQILIRYNLPVVLLSLAMNRPYQFYHYVPMFSYWFFILYLLMAMPPHVCAKSAQANPMHHFYLLLKVVLLAAVMSTFYLSEVFFERIFILRPWRGLFVYPADSVQEWHYRWKTDRYTMLAGACFAYVIELLRSYQLLDDQRSTNLFSRRLTCLAFLVCTAGLGSWAVFVYHCRTQLECVEIHSYLSFIPIVCYVVLRNLFGCLRARGSSLFAWIGRIHIELFAVPYHCWLAADANGVLVLFPRFPVANVLLTTFVLLCIAHELHSLSRHVSDCLAPVDRPLTVLRTFCTALLFLVVLGFFYDSVSRL